MKMALCFLAIAVTTAAAAVAETVTTKPSVPTGTGNAAPQNKLAEWSQWRGGPLRSGSLPISAVLTDLAAGADLTEAWRSEALPCGYGHGSAGVVGQGSPVIAEGAALLYVNWPDDASVKLVGPAQRQVRIPERVNDVVLCVDLVTGQTRWKFSAPGKPWRWGISSTPAVAASAVVFVGSTGDGICLDARTGKERWRWRNPEAPKPGYTDMVGPWHASALVVNGQAVFIGAGKNIVACDLATGTERWSRSASEPRHPSTSVESAAKVTFDAARPASNQCWSSPAAWFRDGAWAILANGQAWNPSDGATLWPEKPQNWSHGWSTPAVEGDLVAVMGGKSLLIGQMSRPTVRVIAEVELSNAGGNAAIAKGRVYACGARVENPADKGKPKPVGHVVCVDAATGTLLWDTPCPDLGLMGGPWSFASVTVAGDVVAVLANDRLLLLRTNDGAVLREVLKLDVVNYGVMMALSADRLVTRGWKNLVCYRATRKALP